MFYSVLIYFSAILSTFAFSSSVAKSNLTNVCWIPGFDIRCQDLKMGQYYCEDVQIDERTQQALGCSKEKQYVKVNCYPVENICCDGVLQSGDVVAFQKNVLCKWTNEKSYVTSLLLSIFFGWLGIDRFYLGYPALGLLKMSTFGFMFFWTFADIILIALQIVTPSDGSDFVIAYYGPKLENLNE